MKYKAEIYDTMREVYEEFLNNKNDRNELVAMVDSYEPHELFKDLCEWYGMSASRVEGIYELFYGKGEHKGDGGWFPMCMPK